MGSPQPSQRLEAMGIKIELNGFPSGTKERDLANYDQIVDAFSHCFYSGLFDDINMPDPYAAWPYEQTYWDTFFKKVTPSGYVVQVSQSATSACFGTTTDFQAAAAF